jgi:hypothetical protein
MSRCHKHIHTFSAVTLHMSVICHILCESLHHLRKFFSSSIPVPPYFFVCPYVKLVIDSSLNRNPHVSFVWRQSSTADFFSHETLLTKLFDYFDSIDKKSGTPHGTLPPPGMVRSMRKSAVTDTKKKMSAEAEAAVDFEPKRLLRLKIKYIIPVVATSEDQSKTCA